MITPIRGRKEVAGAACLHGIQPIRNDNPDKGTEGAPSWKDTCTPLD